MSEQCEHQVIETPDAAGTAAADAQLASSPSGNRGLQHVGPAARSFLRKVDTPAGFWRPVLVVAAVAAVGGQHRAAWAQLATIDFTNLIQNTSTALNTAQQVKNTYDLVRSSAKQVEYTLQNLKRLDPTSFQGVVDTYNQGLMTYAVYEGGRQGIGYQAASVRHSFETLFPSLTRARAMQPRQYPSNQTDRQTAMQSAAYSAVAAQANERQLQENQMLARRIALKSQAAPGEVAQIQLVIESLMVVQKQLDTLTKMLSASERVNAMAAAEASSSSMVASEMSRRAMAGYRNRGTPSPPPRKPSGP